MLKKLVKKFYMEELNRRNLTKKRNLLLFLQKKELV